MYAGVHKHANMCVYVIMFGECLLVLVNVSMGRLQQRCSSLRTCAVARHSSTYIAITFKGIRRSVLGNEEIATMLLTSISIWQRAHMCLKASTQFDIRICI